MAGIFNAAATLRLPDVSRWLRVSRTLPIGHSSFPMASPIRTRLDIEDPWERYTRLPPGPKTVLRLKSLVFLTTTKTAFVECLTRGGVRTPDGRAWAGASVNMALEVLSRERLLTEDLACLPALLHRVAIDAVAAPEGELLIAAVRRAFSPRHAGLYYVSRQVAEPSSLLRLARLAVYANDATEFIAQRDQHDSAFAPHRLTTLLGRLLRDEPFAADWLDSRAPAIQLALFEGRLAAFLAGHLSIPGMAELIARYRGRQDRPGFAPVRRALLEHDVLALRLDDVRGALAKSGRGRRAAAPGHGGDAALPGRGERRGDRPLPCGPQGTAQAGRQAQAVPGRRAWPVLPDGAAARQRRGAACRDPGRHRCAAAGRPAASRRVDRAATAAVAGAGPGGQGARADRADERHPIRRSARRRLHRAGGACDRSEYLAPAS